MDIPNVYVNVNLIVFHVWMEVLEIQLPVNVQILQVHQIMIVNRLYHAWVTQFG